MELSQTDIEEVIKAVKAEVKIKGNSSIQHRLILHFNLPDGKGTAVTFGAISTIEGYITKDNRYRSETNPNSKLDYLIRKNHFTVSHPILYALIMLVSGIILGNLLPKFLSFF